MGEYSRVNLLGKVGLWNGKERKGAWEIIYDFFLSFSSSVSLTIAVPTAVYLRTKLLCEYISEEVDIDFELSNFLMVIYLDFISHSTKKYDPLSMYRSIQPVYQKNDLLIIKQGEQVLTERKKHNTTWTEIVITMDKKDVMKGEMILYELDELYGHQITFEQMIGNLWHNFIDGYKRGEHAKALQKIIHMLKKQQKKDLT